MANKYANQIYEAIDILTEQKLRNLKLDRTVQAIVKDNTKAKEGYYTVEIQDANQSQQVIVRSNRIDYVYPLNSCVYVTIPQNDSTFDKWILGSAEVEAQELDAYYYESERPVQDDSNTFDGALALAQLIGGGDMLIIDFNVADTDLNDGDGKLSFKGALKVGNTELVSVDLNENDIEGDPYSVDDIQRFTYKIPTHEYEITDIISFSVTSSTDISINKIYIGKSDNTPFTKLLTAKLLDTADPPEPKEKIVFNFAAAADSETLQLQAYYNGVAINNNVGYSWAFDDATMNHVIVGYKNIKQAVFSRNELWRDGTFNFTAVIIYDGERVPITSSVSSINFPIVSINQSTAEETTTLTANLMVGSEIKVNPWGSRTQLTYLWSNGSTTPSIEMPKLKSGDSQNYTCTVSQQGYVIGNDTSTVAPQPEGEVQGITAITNGNALLVWDESNTFKNGEITLSVTIYDVTGEAVCSTADDETDWEWLENITWKIPSNSLYEEVSRGAGNRTLTITGKEKFDPPVELPQIEVTLNINESAFLEKYPNRQLKAYSNIVAKTSFAATQQGMPGTNGSKYIVQPLVDYAELDFSVQVNFEYVDFEWNDDDGNYHPKFTFNITVPDTTKKAELIEKFSSFTINIENTEAGQSLESTYNNLNETIGTNGNPIHLQLNSTDFYDDPEQYRDDHEYLSKLNIKIYFDEDESLSFISTGIQSYMFKIDGADEGTFSDGPNFEYQIISPWNDSYSFQEYGFLAAAAPYIRVKPRVWDVELRQWLFEENLNYATNLMYNRTGITKVQDSDEYHLTASTIDYNTTNIIRLTVTLDGKKFTSYLPLVIGSGISAIHANFIGILDHPFFYVMYDSTSTVPFYRYKGKRYNWIQEDQIELSQVSKYLIVDNETKLSINENIIFTNDAENEILKITYGTDNTYFYVPILFANVTSLYDFVGEWDGESAKIGDDYVISPIAAFGSKDDNNQFTGLVLGQSKGADSWNQTFTLNKVRIPNTDNGKYYIVFGNETQPQELVKIIPKQTHLLQIKGFLDPEDSTNRYDFSEPYPYIVLSAQKEYYWDNDDIYRWLYLYGIDDNTWEELINDYADATAIFFYNGEEIISTGGVRGSITITETNDILGMVAYHNNERTFELDANTGKLNIGKTGKGQISIDPTSDIAAIYGGNYKEQSKGISQGSGMMINLAEPGVYWGNGNFSVDKEGHLNAVNGSFTGHITATSGSIANFQINGSNLIGYNENIPTIGLCSTNDSSGYAFWAGGYNGQVPGTNAPFRVDHNGKLIAENADLIGSLTAANISTNSGLFTVDSNGILTTQKAYILNEGQIGGFNLNNNILKSGNFIIDPINQLITFGNTSLKQSNISYTTENPLAIYFTGAAESNKISYKTVQTETGGKPAIYFYNYLSPRFYYRFISNADGTGYYNNSSHKNRNSINLYFYYKKYGDLSDSWIQFNSLSFSSNTVYTGYRSYSNDDNFVEVFSTSPSAVKIKIEASRTIYIDNQYQSSYRVVAYESDWISLGTTITMTSGAAHVEADYQTVTAGTEIACTGPFLPDQDGTISLGNSAFRWSQVWAVTGTIQTSDRNAKNSIEAIPSQYLDFYDKLNPVRYKFNQNTSNRYHIGLIAQDVEKALQESNISTQDFAGFISYAQEDGTGYGLRYDEFIALCIAKTQQQDREISELKSEIQELRVLISQLTGQEG